VVSRAACADAKRGRAAVNTYWALPPDEALIIEFDAHDGLWMLTNMGVFSNSMDFLYRPVSYTPSRTKVDSDGTVRLILAHDDPGYHNWIDTQGFERGNVTYRHLLEGRPVPLSTRVLRCGRASTGFGSVMSCETAFSISPWALPGAMLPTYDTGRRRPRIRHDPIRQVTSSGRRRCAAAFLNQNAAVRPQHNCQA
jgi:hypothetical protein